MRNRAKCNKCHMIPQDFTINELNPRCPSCQIEDTLEMDPNCIPLAVRLITKEEAKEMFADRINNEK